MKFKKIFVILSVLLIALLTVGTTSAIDSDNVADNNISTQSVFDVENTLSSSNDNQILSEVIVVDAEDGHNEMDEPTIQVAIDNAKANDTIIINGKSYVHCHFVVDKPLTIKSDVGTSFSPCPGNTKGSGYRGIFYISPEASGTVIEGFSILNNLAGENDYGILVRGASDVVIRDCTIRSVLEADAVRIENAVSTNLVNLTVSSLTNGINVKNSQKTLIEGNVIKNSQYGVNIVDSSETTFTNNVITSNKASGIYIDKGTRDTLILSNNITDNKGKGIDIEYGDNVKILSNYIAFNRNDNAGAGVYINCNVIKVEVKGNFLKQNGLYGVLMDHRVKNIGPDLLGEDLLIVDNNYMMAHEHRAIYHIEYKPFAGGDFIYDADKDTYIQVEEGKGNYIAGMTTAYLRYAYLIDEQLCPSIYNKETLWTQGNFRLQLSEITQVKRGLYSISVVNPNGEIAEDLSSVYVTFYLNKNNTEQIPQEGDVYRTVLIENGTATARFYADEFKEHDNVLLVSFPGTKSKITNNPYKQTDIKDSDIPGMIKETVLSLSDLTTYPNSGEYVIANLKDETGLALAGENITFAVNSKSCTVATDKEGNAKLGVSISDEGKYILKAVYAGDGVDYAESESQTVVTVKKIATQIESEGYYVVPGIVDYYTVVLKDSNANPLNQQRVAFNVAGKNYVVTTNSKGQATIRVLFDKNNADYKVTINYAGNNKYVHSSNSSVIHVKYSTKSPQLTVPSMGVPPKTDKWYTITLKGFRGEPLANQYVVINVDGVKYYKYTDNKGQVSIKLQFSEIGKYKVTALYPGSSVYKRTSVSNYITVDKVSTKIAAENCSVIPGESKTIPAVLTTGSGEKLPYQTVLVKISDKTYIKRTDANGQTNIVYTFKDSKVYPIQLTFEGTYKYKAFNTNIYVNAKKTDSTIISYDKTFSRGSAQDFTITLNDEYNKRISNQNVIFTFNGQNVTKTTDSNGQCGINLASNVASFDVTTTYLGNDQFNSISNTNMVTVLDNGADIVYVDADIPNDEIQRILDSCDNGNTVEFLGDSYDDISLTVSKQLNVLSQVGTILNAKKSAPVFKIVSSDVNISDFDINGNSYDAICIAANNVNIINNNISNMLDESKWDEYRASTISLPGYGINISNSKNVKVLNNEISLFESGVYAEKSSRLTIGNNVLKENNYGIKYGANVKNSKIDSNLISNSIGLYTLEVPEGPRGYAVFLNNSAVDVKITNNNLSWNHIGISFDCNGSTGIVVTGNVITDNVLEGVRFNAGYDLAENPVDPVITDNAIYRNARGPSMMILGEMSANPAGRYGPGEWDDDAKLHIDANWYGVNKLRTWDNETGIVGIGTMCPRIKTSEIKFDEIESQGQGKYEVTFKKDNKTASNLPEFNLFATLNRGTTHEAEVEFIITDGVGTFGFDADKFGESKNIIEISVGSLHDDDRTYKAFYTYIVPKS